MAWWWQRKNTQLDSYNCTQLRKYGTNYRTIQGPITKMKQCNCQWKEYLRSINFQCLVLLVIIFIQILVCDNWQVLIIIWFKPMNSTMLQKWSIQSLSLSWYTQKHRVLQNLKTHISAQIPPSPFIKKRWKTRSSITIYINMFSSYQPS